MFLSLTAATLVLGAAAGISEGRLDSLLAANRYAIEREEQGWSGPGLEFLEQVASDSELFLIGTPPYREASLVTEQLTGRLAPLGYGTLGIAEGPATASRIAAVLRAAGGLERLETELIKYPDSLSSTSHEQLEMFDAATRLGVRLQGFDLESPTTWRWQLARLGELADDAWGVGLTTRLGGAAWEGFSRFESLSDDRELFMFKVTGAELEKLDAALGDCGEEAWDTLAALRGSCAIWKKWGFFRSELYRTLRAEWMEQRLRSMWEHAGPDGKLIVQSHADDLRRGPDDPGLRGLGELARELALTRGSSSFHLNLIASEALRWNGRVGDLTRDEPWLEHFEDESAVYDLRPLRSWFEDERCRRLHPSIAELCRHFDAVWVIPRLHPATPLEQ